MNALELRELSYTYPGAPAPALVDLNLTIPEGELVIVAGLSASGKSTLLGLASGIVPHFHGGTLAGRAEVCGLDLREHGPAQLAVHVGTLFQDPETQVLMGTPRAELAFPLENRGFDQVAVARSVEEVALALGIESLLEQRTPTLSGGELQRVALGAALAGRPRLLALDEPTAQLDPVAGDELLGLLRRLNEEWGTTILLAEHRLERCLAAADRVIALEQGRLVCNAPPAQFLDWAHDNSRTLETPAARLIASLGLDPPPTGVKQARATLARHGLLPAQAAQPVATEPPAKPRRRHRSDRDAPLRFEKVWHEVPRGRAILAAVTLTIEPGELVALLGRNGAGKSTLLRHAAGLMAPTRGKLTSAGHVALLLQDPSAYFTHDRVAGELPGAALQAAGLGHLAQRNPRDLSGGERQRLALALVGADEASVLCLDEPTRGMDRQAKADLAAHLRERAAAGAAVIVATHDPEFAAAFATRAILMADGRILADAPPAAILSGGWYFATETARVLGGHAGALTPEQGVAALRTPALR
ncbi:MAG: ATP-binding cassette domain-containing protein [Solirubrobacteraceae bacterium]